MKRTTTFLLVMLGFTVGSYGQTSFPFAVHYNKTILPVDVGLSRPLRIILDSGMGWDGLLIYNPDIRDSIDLVNPVGANVGGAGQGSAPSAIFSDSMSFSIGGVEFKDQRFVVLQTDAFRGFPSDGVTGNSLLGHFAVEINYDDSTITLHNPDSLRPEGLWTAIPLVFNENNIPCLKVGISVTDEEPVLLDCYIDYASSETLELLTRPEQKFTLPEEIREVYLGRGLSGDIYGKKGNVSRVIIGPYESHDLEAAFVPAEARSKQTGADAVLAAGLLRQFNLIFNYAHRTLYIRPNKSYNK
ncbi:MAG: hypothetical protein KBB71_03360 [Lentimicrobiaceae bacterium]|nr:hypothetical protein [Lentimicrobiaceae bacterium]